MEQTLHINGEDFFLFLERRAGAVLYANESRDKYLRIGDPQTVARELAFHKKLLSEGFPVAKILGEGEFQKRLYWIEESLGVEHCGDIFFRETRELGGISEKTFGHFLEIVRQTKSAQERTLIRHVSDLTALRQAVFMDELMKELPDQRMRMKKIWQWIQDDLRDWPFCLTHGDFLPNNILEGGVIDFGDHFFGPIGYDIVNAITTAWWFPKDECFEYRRKWSFSDAQTDEFFAEAGTFTDNGETFNVLEKFDSLFFLRATWWTVRNHKMPLLQQWRYEKYCRLMDAWERGQPLEKYWRAHKDE